MQTGSDEKKSDKHTAGLGEIHGCQRVGDKPYEHSGPAISVTFLGVSWS